MLMEASVCAIDGAGDLDASLEEDVRDAFPDMPDSIKDRDADVW